MTDELQPFSEYDGRIRSIWDEDTGELWFAVVDVIEVLTDSDNPAVYWRQMKNRDESGVLVTICNGFPMKHKTNGRTYKTDCATEAGVLRIIQSVPSSKAEPIRQWMAKTGSRRLKEIRNDPIEAKREMLRMAGLSDQEIQIRIDQMKTKNNLITEWTARGIKSDESEVLTDEIHKGAFEGMTRQNHADLKALEEGDILEDHMTPMEVAFDVFGKAETLTGIQENDPKGFEENKDVAQEAGERTGRMRRSYENETGRKVISDKSYLNEKKRLTNNEEKNSDNKKG